MAKTDILPRLMMNLSSDPVAGARSQKTYTLQEDGLGGLRVLRVIEAQARLLGGAFTKKPSKVRSALVGGVGFINLYEVFVDGITDVRDLELPAFEKKEIGILNAQLVERMKEFTGDIDDHHLYLMEYPDGYLLSLNNQMLAFSPKWP